MRTAPGLQRLLGTALQDGGWFDAGHEQAVREVAQREDPDQRVRDLRSLLAEETRLGMMVGVAVGFELAHELQGRDAEDESRNLNRESEDQTRNQEED